MKPSELAMERIFSSPNLIEVTQLEDTLERARIACFIRNEISSGLSPEIPMTESTPELWLEDANDSDDAMEIKKHRQEPPNVTGAKWVCPTCGEASDSQFNSSWKCGMTRS